MEAKHTPGPWRAAECNVWPSDGDDGRRNWDIRSGEPCLTPFQNYRTGFMDCGGRAVAFTSCGSTTREEEAANARLIAAAPDLLAVVEELLGSADYWSEYEVPVGIVDRMKAAVEAVKGLSLARKAVASGL